MGEQSSSSSSWSPPAIPQDHEENNDNTNVHSTKHTVSAEDHAKTRAIHTLLEQAGLLFLVQSPRRSRHDACPRSTLLVVLAICTLSAPLLIALKVDGFFPHVSWLVTWTPLWILSLVYVWSNWGDDCFNLCCAMTSLAIQVLLVLKLDAQWLPRNGLTWWHVFAPLLLVDGLVLVTRWPFQSDPIVTATDVQHALGEPPEQTI